MFSPSNRCDRWKVLVLTTFFISLVMLKLSLPDLRLSRFFNLTDAEGYRPTFEYNVSAFPDEQFSFPGINETDVFSKRLTIYPTSVQYTGPLADEQNETENIIKSLFQPGLSQEEREVVLAVFQVFIRACAKFNISFFLHSGTLLGSMRHHDLIPWDDDVDVMLNTTSKSTLRQALSSTGDQFRLLDLEDRWWKFYWVNTNTLPHKDFRWPFIDIFFFIENETHIFDESSTFRDYYFFPKQHVFPLSLHPFAGAMLPVPYKMAEVVAHNYSPDLCMSSNFMHKLEEDVPLEFQKQISCKHLEHIYPFVKRRVVGNVVHEDLMKGNVLISSVTLPKDGG